jgi:hypothetical protein
VHPQINRENVELNRKLPTGRSTTLFCDATGKPPPKIQWYFNNTLITDKFTNIVMGTDNKYIQVTALIIICSVFNKVEGFVAFLLILALC